MTLKTLIYIIAFIAVFCLIVAGATGYKPSDLQLKYELGQLCKANPNLKCQELVDLCKDSFKLGQPCRPFEALEEELRLKQAK